MQCRAVPGEGKCSFQGWIILCILEPINRVIKPYFPLVNYCGWQSSRAELRAGRRAEPDHLEPGAPPPDLSGMMWHRASPGTGRCRPGGEVWAEIWMQWAAEGCRGKHNCGLHSWWTLSWHVGIRVFPSFPLIRPCLFVLCFHPLNILHCQPVGAEKVGHPAMMIIH